MRRFHARAWKPFDAHFAEIIENFELHSRIFESLVTATTAELALGFYKEWDKQMTKMEQVMKGIHGGPKLQEQNKKLLLDSAIKSLQERVAATPWATTFEYARSQRIQDSGEWLLAHPTLTRYTKDNMDQSLALGDTNVLFLYGKPGYGKTTLATVLVDHLKIKYSRTRNGGPLAFFFFDRQSRSSRSHDAFRAVLSQLIFSRRFDEIVLDIAAIAQPDHDTGQRSASDDEIFSVLHLFMLQFSDCTLVLDGIDECTDREHLLTMLSRLSLDHKNCKFFLFSRPVMKINKNLRTRCEIMELDSTENFGDMEVYVQSKIKELVENDELVIPSTTSADQVVSSIVLRANGMFLWATLFLNYLRLPSLSISQRREAIEDADKFQGLYGLYDGIIALIEREYPGNSRRNIRRALSWVAGAFRTLHVDELRVAVAQTEETTFQEDDTIPNFMDAIGPMTGALIEVTKERTVRLIHITVAEYLVSISSEVPSDFKNEDDFDFKPAIVHRYVAATCLAYMSYTVPLGPYVDRRTSGAEFDTVLKDYPLLTYCSTYWVAHLREFIHNFELSSCTGGLRISQELGERATSFLSDKSKFTSWTEIFWHLLCPNEVWAMQHFDWKNFPSILPDSSIRYAASLLHEAYQEHQVLAKTWGDLLEKYPEEIWQPSISAFSNSKLRKSLGQAEVSSILNKSMILHDSVVLQTKCSSSGNTIGILQAHYPRM